MRKISVCFACFFILIVMGCGNTSGDPTARITLAADSALAEVTPGGSAVITATVTKAGGTATTPTTPTTTTGTTPTTATPTAPSGWGENVTFTLLTANGARLSAPTQKTDGDGKARMVYTAGNNYNQDVIQATLDNGMSASIVIKKTGSVSGPSITVKATPTSVKAFGYSTIQVTVTDGNDATKPISGETVEFKLVENNSGATLITQNAVTDASGQASATYRAGGNEPAQDVVQAKLLSNGSTSSVVIDVTATSAFSIDVSANPMELTAKASNSVLTANVKDNLGAAASGVIVTFTVTRGTLSVLSATTDGSGNAVTTFTGDGGSSGTGVVTASITVGGNTYTNAVVINIP